MDNDELDPQALVSKMTEYGIFTEGTQVLNFNITGEGDVKKAVLDLNKVENDEGVSDSVFLVEIGNTFIENFELSQPDSQGKWSRPGRSYRSYLCS